MNNPIILDGATGTMLQKNSMPTGAHTPLWAIENPQVLLKIQNEYKENGSDIVYSCTFGASPSKLKEAGFLGDVSSLNAKLVEISKKTGAKVAGDVSPSGLFIPPMGSSSADELIENFAIQIEGLAKGGADYIVIETMLDIIEAKVAVAAAKQVCKLPVLVTVTFDENKRTLTGTTPEAAVVILQAAGADAVGCNCSTGPSDMLEIIKRMAKVANIPLIAKPNAGMPIIENGIINYNMSPQDFAGYAADFIANGVHYLGGCCGSEPKHIKALKQATASLEVISLNNNRKFFSTAKDAVCIDNPKYSPEVIVDDDFFDSCMDYSEEYDIITVRIDTKENLDSFQDYCNIINSPIKIVSANDEVYKQAILVYGGLSSN